MKILGLDLGPASIGWSLIEIDKDFNPIRLLGLGSRVIHYNNDKTATDFSKGKGESACSQRTTYRSMRRNIDRFQLHRQQLKDLMLSIGLISEDYKTQPLNPLDLWKLRADGATPSRQLSLNQIGQVLFHINHRRGYRHAKSDIGDSSQSNYLSKISDREGLIKESGQTVGQFFYEKIKESEVIHPNGKKHYTYRVKEEVFPRRSYEEEVTRILDVQSEFYPDVLTDKNRKDLKQVIFYQRPLKSCKNLVSFCEFEKKEFLNKEGKKVENGPKVAPRTSPLAQVCRIYEAINNIRLINPRIKAKGGILAPTLFDNQESIPKNARKLALEYKINNEERKRIFDYLNTHEKMTTSDLLKILGLKKSDGFVSDKNLGKGIQGNTTKYEIDKALSDMPNKERLLSFDLREIIPEHDAVVDSVTGEVVPQISDSCFFQPLYELWHTLYSIDNKEELFKVLKEKFGIEDNNILENLYALDFVKAGYSNKSSKFMRKLIPLLQRGYMYSEACETLGINHSGSLTKEENDKRVLNESIPQLHKGDLRQPVVEKILNQTINVVNAIIKEYGPIDEARIEMARELKKDKAGRERLSTEINKTERLNKALAEEIRSLDILPTRRRIQKMKMLKETDNKCMYCGTPVTPFQFIEGHGYEIEHIIPRSRLFDDSFSNKVCACRKCNAEKGAQTGYDYMKSKGEQALNQYLERIEDLHKNKKISNTKAKYLKMTASDIPNDFINRDLVETGYITRKAKDILSKAIRNVYASSGKVTDFFRRSWGYDTILHDLNMPRYETAGLVEEVEYETHGQKHTAKRIKEWTKRKDHRHHALDALVVALTRQGYIQRLNTLNSKDQKGSDNEWSNLDKWASERPHFSRKEVMKALEEVSISFKSGKKLVTPGKRYIHQKGKRICVQENILVPRSALHKETIYGIIKVDDGYKTLKYALENIPLIKNEKIQKIFELRLKDFDGDKSKTLKSFKKEPLTFNGKKLEKVMCIRFETVVKYPIASIQFKDIKYIVDKNIRQIIESRFKEVGNKDNDFVKSLSDRPLFSDKEEKNKIRTVRLFANLDIGTLAGVRKNPKGDIIGYAQTRNNHHIAFYRNNEGKFIESVISFWECVKRKRNGLPIIIKNPDEAWDKIISLGENEDVEMLSKSLPESGSEFVMSLQRNEMVILGMSDDEWKDALKYKDYKMLNKYLYRVLKLSSGDYWFKYHTSTISNIENGDKELKQYYRLGLSSLFKLNPHKVPVSLLGKIIVPSDD